MATSVLIVDDHRGFRSSTRELLEMEGMTVVGEAASGASAVAVARALRPDVVLLDVLLPDTTGFVVADALARLEPAPIVVLVSSREATDYGGLVATSAARGFISKADLTAERLRSVIG